MADSARPPVDRTLIRKLGAVLWPYRWWVGLALVLTFGAAFLGPLRPRLVQIAIDGYITEGDAQGLLTIVGWLALVLAGEGLFAFTRGYLTQWIGQKTLFDLRVRVFRHIERQRLGFFDKTPIGTLITRATSDVEALGDFLSSALVTVLGDLARLVFIMAFMLSLNVELGLVALVSLPFMIVATEFFRRRMRVAFRETRKQVARLNAFVQEHVSGMSVVQIFGREAEEQRRFEAINADHREAHIKTIWWFALFWPVIDFIAAGALGLVLWYGGTEAMREALTVGTLIAFIQYVRMFFEPVRNLSDQLTTLQSALASSERIFGLLDNDQSVDEAETPTHLPEGRARGRITFEDVWFAYERLPAQREGEKGDEARENAPEASGDGSAGPSSPIPHPSSLPDWNWVLKGVSFDAEPGSTLALVGHTGSGKTTVLNLLLRFYEPQRGRI
ncbi:MAG: ABC transporter transmembrane domain-containing protein, partial [Bacteroidota bacterium]